MRTPSTFQQVWTVPVVYAAFGIAWVLMGDYLLAATPLPTETQDAIQSIKGVLFVLISTLLVAVLTYFQVVRAQHFNQTLSQRDERFRLALGSIREAAFDYDVKRGILHWSHGLQQLLGVHNADSMSTLEQFRAHIHPQDLPQTVTAYETTLNGGNRNYRDVFRIRNAEQHYIWVECRGLMVRDTEGRPDRFVGIMRDVTERQIFEMDLIASNRALTALSEGNREIMQAVDVEQVVQRICQVLVNRAGYSMAWVSQITDGNKLSMQCIAGHPSSILDAEPIRIDGVSAQASPITLAVAERRIIHCAVDEPADSFRQWREAACAQGFSACLALPIMLQPLGLRESTPYGALAVYLSNGETFDERERTLLESLSQDIGLALNVLINHAKSDAAQLLATRAEVRLDHILEQTIIALSATVERRDPFAQGHETHMADIAVKLAQKLGLEGDALRGIHVGALLHDIGKVSISSEILTKPATLSAAEMTVVRQHPKFGHDMVAKIDFPWPVKRMILEHHERMDGSGYPQALKGDEICLEARIIAVVDVAEAITSSRPYRPAHTLAEALAVLSEPGKFDPKVVSAFTQMARDGEIKLAG